ncbi:MAG: GtrA family protein [Clostridia bacterium]|nr:GtrA family protein [Clostridia bacterium]
MKIIKRILKDFPVLREMFLYGIIGSVSAGMDSLVFIGLRYLNVGLYISNFIGINLGITLSFTLNTSFNFKKTDKLAKRAISFYTVGYSGLLLSMGIMFIGTDWLHINENVVKLASVFVVAAFQFILNKFITFRKR